MAVTYDSTELVSATYNPRYVKHESVAERFLMTQALAREDGEVLVAERYGVKTVFLRGTLKGSSQADLESKIDAFTELLSRPQKNLDIDWNGSTRRFVATCEKHEFDRDHYHLSIVPWTAQFVILSGEGKDTSTTQPTAADGDAVIFDPSSDPTGQAAFTLAGGKPPRPSIALGFSAGSTVRGIEYLNEDNGERIVVTYPGSWGNSRTVTIDCDAKTVTGDVVDGVTKQLNFYGTFPKFKIGTNNIKIKMGGIVNQKSTDDVVADLSSTDAVLDATTDKLAQSFMVPYGDATFNGITLGIYKAGTPGNITWRVETDNAGKPSGSLVDANATGTISHGTIGTSAEYETDFSTNPWTLSANTVYWLVLSAGATLDGSNKYMFPIPTRSTYPRGLARYSTDTGSTWQDFGSKFDISFRILYGGSQATVSVAHTVTYYKTYL